MQEKILVVDDEKALRETVTYNLEKMGYSVVAASDGPEALGLAKTQHPDLIILDIMLPGMDGLEVCRQIRKEMNTPVIMLTARDDEIDRVVGLEVGADDYLTKPFSMRELMARVKAMLRRAELIRVEMLAGDGRNDAHIQLSEFEIDKDRHEIRLSGRVLQLKPKEYELLYFFISNPGVAFTREIILEKVWGWDFPGESRTVDVHIRWLREKIEADPKNPKHLVTVRGAGYRFEG